MFINRLINQGSAPMLEQVAKFTSQRHGLLLDNLANVSTFGYQQKDLSLDGFQAMLRERSEVRQASPPGSVGYDDIQAEVENPQSGILFHDGNNRSMEQLTSDVAKNALMHNLAIELLRKQFATLDMALKERVT